MIEEDASTSEAQERAEIDSIPKLQPCPYCRLSMSKVNRFTGEIRPCSACVARKYLLRQYGLTLYDFRKMMEDQEHSCAICYRKFSATVRSHLPHIDHCQENGHVRGLLCRWCNRGLGTFNYNSDWLKNAIKYLIHNQIKRCWWVQRLIGT